MFVRKANPVLTVLAEWPGGVNTIQVELIILKEEMMKSIVKIWIRMLFVSLLTVMVAACSSDSSDDSGSGDTDNNLSDITGYDIVDTGQTACYDDDGEEISCPEAGEVFYGQDGQFDGNQPSLTDNGDGTVTDNVTGLMWEQTPEDTGWNYDDAEDYCDSLELAKYDDWRILTTKELFSISNFSEGWPYEMGASRRRSFSDF